MLHYIKTNKIVNAVWTNHSNQNINDFTEFYSKWAFKRNPIMSNDIDKLLQEVKNKGQFAVIQTTGNIFLPLGQAEKLVVDFIFNIKEPFLVCGQILDEYKRPRMNKPPVAFPSGTYSIFPGCMIVNLEIFKQLNCPKFGEPSIGNVTVCKPTRNEGNVHDDYTPLKITPSTTEVLTKRTEGWNFVDVSMKNNMAIFNLPERLRSNLRHLYPDSKLYSAIKAVEDDLENYKGRVWHVNTESVDPVPQNKRGAIDSLFSVCSGLKPNCVLHKNGFHEQTNIVFFDYTIEALRFRQKMIEDWDGVDYVNYIESTRHVNSKNYYGVDNDHKNRYWKTIIDFFGSQNAFVEHWNRFRKLKFNYVHCDLSDVNDHHKVLQHLKSGQNNYLWWSKAFATVYHYVVAGRDKHKVSQQWEDYVFKIDPDATIDRIL